MLHHARFRGNPRRVGPKVGKRDKYPQRVSCRVSKRPNFGPGGRNRYIAQDSPQLRYALECWTGLNRAATRRWLRGDATRNATQELLASTPEHVLRTFGALPNAR